MSQKSVPIIGEIVRSILKKNNMSLIELQLKINPGLKDPTNTSALSRTLSKGRTTPSMRTAIAKALNVKEEELTDKDRDIHSHYWFLSVSGASLFPEHLVHGSVSCVLDEIFRKCSKHLGFLLSRGQGRETRNRIEIGLENGRLRDSACHLNFLDDQFICKRRINHTLIMAA